MNEDLNKFDFLDDFKIECREHLGKLNQLLLELEKSPDSKETLETVSRELHTLKAASRLMGFDKIEKITHQLEDFFVQVHQRQVGFVSRHADIVLDALDAIATCLHDLPDISRFDSDRLLANIELAKNGQAERARLATATPEGANVPMPTNEPTAPSRPNAQTEQGKTADETTWRETSEKEADEGSESVRIRTGKLDELFNLVGELVMCKLRTEETQRQFHHFLTQLQHIQEDSQSRQGEPQAGTAPGNARGHLADQFQRLERMASAALAQMGADSALLANVSERMRDGIMQLRMLPLRQLFQTIPRIIRDISREEGKKVALQMKGDDIEIDRTILEQIKDPLLHLLRNAVSHGVETPEERQSLGKPATGTVTVEAKRQGSQILILVQDDGRGIDLERIREKAMALGLINQDEAERMSEQDTLRLIFVSGFSTRQEAGTIAGRGLGLAIVENSVSHLKGSVEVSSQPGLGSSFTIRLPLTLATAHVLLIRIDKEVYALPIHTIQEIILLTPAMIEKVQNRDSIYLRECTVPIVDLAAVLERPLRPPLSQRRIAIVVAEGDDQRIAFAVDEVLGEHEIVAKSLGSQVRKVRYIQGASILGKGEVVLILNVARLFHASRTVSSSAATTEDRQETATRKQTRVLVVDDSLTTRRLEQAILEAAGYLVEIAVHGEDALKKLKSQNCDIVITDIQMPVMDGMALTRAICRDPQYKNMPVVIVSGLDSEEHKRQGLEAGAKGYITKGQFNQDTLIELIERLTRKTA